LASRFSWHMVYHLFKKLPGEVVSSCL